ncbi:pilus assembly protein TadG-related protein [Pseudoduganella namucuonensis]|uniref:Putative Flp pilus-assembly TadE/G-like n=1 Tax=Pseudoduganella namucuonensis TaxID=1035707 RepID=A0A1I7GZE2_9BURK|nr:TadE/TadG family type IV pilus assembly protein [Pseudoduganella namucuonensis]SFU53799.1 Putative Flp pilus-assembly TadE/G-like [Pseudoduganella namucuonensis]
MRQRSDIPRGAYARRAGQRGAMTVMFAIVAAVLLGFIGVALDLGMLYNRKAELQGMADQIALASARQLNGTAAGVANALAAASAIAGGFKYQYNQRDVVWSDAAIRFGSESDGAWLDAAAAQSAPSGLGFVKVDTTALDEAHGKIDLVFMRALSGALESVTTGGRAVAGRASIRVAPLAVCAMAATPAASRTNPGTPPQVELVEFGFRRGVVYDLMQLNPGATTPENFAIDPTAPPGSAGAAANMLQATIGPFVCSGTMAMPRVTGGAITVGRPFPLASLYQHLNSRFDQYTGGYCTPNGAPPDTNVRPFIYNVNSWMAVAPSGQTALSTTVGGKLWTVADQLPGTAGTASAYGPLWAYARAVPFSSYVAGTPEPAAGYTPFATSVWATLYQSAPPTAAASYPSGVSTPYKAIAGVNFLAPTLATKPGLANRRVLNVPLLSCPVGAGATTTATVLGIGRFFMTVPATATSLPAEFAGAVPEQSLGGQVELFP